MRICEQCIIAAIDYDVLVGKTVEVVSVDDCENGADCRDKYGDYPRED